MMGGDNNFLNLPGKDNASLFDVVHGTSQSRALNELQSK